MSCDRLWEVDAFREGRLIGADAASWQRHRVTCETCAERYEADERLVTLANQLEYPELDPLRARRLRAGVLRGIGQRTPPKRTPLLVAAFVVFATASAAAGWHATRAPVPVTASPSVPEEPVESPPPPIVVHAPVEPVPSSPPSVSAPSAPIAVPVDTAADDYEAAARAYRRHEYDDAAARFERFAEAHPHARQMEDASFLRASALAFAGHEAEAATLAEQFSKRFPGSIHARDAAALVARQARKNGDCPKARAVLAPWPETPTGCDL